jgi:hypothetical protein
MVDTKIQYSNLIRKTIKTNKKINSVFVNGQTTECTVNIQFIEIKLKG